MMSPEEFLALAGKLVFLSPEALSLDTTLESINWDSLVNMSFIAEVDEHLGKEVNADDLFDSKTLGDVYRLVAN